MDSVSTMPVSGCFGGIDEAGRGPLAGPVVAAIVVLAPGQSIAGVRDSKQLSAGRREVLAADIRREALGWALGAAEPAEIDALNILQATFLAMVRAASALAGAIPPLIRVDGNRLPHLPGYSGRLEAVVGGDRRCQAIAAASILAKVQRDAIMQVLHGEYPQYGFDCHKGYPTAAHRAALHRHGPSPAHRRSFAPVRAVCTA